MVAASERSVLVTVFDLHPDEVQELGGGEILYAKAHEHRARLGRFAPEQERQSCSFERIYFSRGGDIKIYNERKALGRLIIPRVLEAVNYEIENTVFSFIPNTAETSFLGMMKGLEDELNKIKIKQIMELGPDPQEKDVKRILSVRMRMEKSADKDVKMRTFIADDSSRDEMVSHVYDVTRGIIENEVDNLVCIDDSIVRGTTLKKSILHMLARLRPKKVVIVSSAPQIRYPDCYGIDMANIGKLIAFQAAIALLKERGMTSVIDGVYQSIQGMKSNGGIKKTNMVREIYAPFSAEEISAKIAELLCPEDFKPE
ncbi:MAG: hypothetical protein KAG66_20840, partial [Methylococcales bacterium]|nr:hypothetical protein [Methylococcales bacterium]